MGNIERSNKKKQKSPWTPHSRLAQRIRQTQRSWHLGYKKGVPISAHLRVSEHTVDCLLEKLFGNKV